MKTQGTQDSKYSQHSQFLRTATAYIVKSNKMNNVSFNESG